MNSVMKPPIIHPFLFAVFPALYLFAYNIRELEYSVVILPIILLLFSVLMLLSAVRFFIRDYQKAALLVSFFLLLFFSYGQFSHIAEKLYSFTGKLLIGPRSFVFMISGVLFCSGAYLIVKTSKRICDITRILNVVAFSLVLLSLLTISKYEINCLRSSCDYRGMANGKTDKTVYGKRTGLPDIYYIILDTYGRADILNDVYGHNNGDFIGYLKRKGFFVAENSKSNYGSTYFSVASSLNLSYLKPKDIRDIFEKYRNNKVFSILKRHSYTNVFISTLDTYTNMNNSDYELGIGWINKLGHIRLNDFSLELINLTSISDLLLKLDFSKYSHKLRRKRIDFALNAIAGTAKNASPVFVYAHILALHTPFVFGPNGEELSSNINYNTDNLLRLYAEGGTRDDYIKLYNGQLDYINKRLIGLIDSILSRKDRLSVIILQGDHGPIPGADPSNPDNSYWKEHYSILNAYYLPDNGSKALYESITPVNTFRLIFNLYLGGSYDLLEDRSYSCDTKLSPPEIVDVTDKVDGKR